MMFRARKNETPLEHWKRFHSEIAEVLGCEFNSVVVTFNAAELAARKAKLFDKLVAMVWADGDTLSVDDVERRMGIAGDLLGNYKTLKQRKKLRKGKR